MGRKRTRTRNKPPLSNVATRFGYGNGDFYHAPTTTQVAMIENLYIRRFTEMSVNRFQWNGLPDEIDERYLEMNLWRSALAVFYYDDHYQKYMCLPGSPQGFLDMQDNPVKFNVTGNQMYNKMIDADDAEAIWANRVRFPDYDILFWYARRLAEVETTVDINIKAARLTRILAASENMRLSVQNFMRQIDEGKPAVFVEQDFAAEDILSVLDMGINPEQIVSVQNVKNRLMNDAMTMLGVSNSNQDKRERMVSDEVDANQEMVLLNRAGALKARKEAAKRINKHWGLNISVDWSEEMKPQEQEGDDDGRIHDDAQRNSSEPTE